MSGHQAAPEREIFQHAVALPPEERAQFLDKACGDNVELRREVESLLAAHAEVGDFLEQPAIDRPDDSNVLTTDYQALSERPGMLIGPYKLMEQIGEGGFGLVYVAEQQRPVRRKVALKIIKPGMDTRDVIARFEAERQALALMDHPNIAKVFDAGTTESGRPYFVMELVRGVPITEFCDQRRLTPRERLELFVALCHAIQHAHQKGIIHRDVKPTNVMVTLHDGRPVVKVIDFGVAKALSQQLTERTIYTQYAQMLGTPLYMSPEQAEMSGLDIDTRSDIYSLGVLLYELLTGTTPFDRQRLNRAAADEIRRIIRDEEPPKPSTRLSHSGDRLASIAAVRGVEPAKLSRLVRGELDWITMKCLDKDRNRRYETANGLARDIESYLRDEAVEASPPSATYRFRKFARRHRAAIAIAAVIATLLVTGIAVSTWQSIRASQAERRAKANEQSALTERDAKEQARREAVASAQQARDAADSERRAKATAERNLYVARMNLVDKALNSGNLIVAEKILGHYGPEAADSHLRGFEWFYWQNVCRKVQREAEFSASAITMAVSADGRLAAIAEFRGQVPMAVKTLNLETGEFNELAELAEFIRCVAITPDASKVAAGSDRGVIRIWKLKAAAATIEINVASMPQDAAFSADGRFLAAATDAVMLWDADTGELVRKFADSHSPPLSVAFTPDQKLLAAGSQDGTLTLWNLEDGTKFSSTKAHAGGLRSIKFVGQTNGLVTSGDDLRLLLWDANAERPKREFDGDQLASVSTSADGTTLLCGGWSGLLRAFDLKTGDERFRLRPNSGHIYGVACLPGDRFVTSGQVVEKWRIRPMDARKVLDIAYVSDIEFSPDGETLATYASQAWRFWSLATLAETQVIKVRGPAPGTILPKTGRLAVRKYDQVIGGDGEIEILESQTGSRIRSIKLSRGLHGITAVAPDEKQLALTGRAEKTLWIVDLESKEELRTLVADTHHLNWASYSPRGDVLVTAGTDGLKLWDTNSWKQIDKFEDHEGPVEHLRFSIDGKILAADKRSSIKLYDAETYDLIDVLEGHSDTIASIAFSPDGKTLASGSYDKTMKLWGIETGEEKATFTFRDSAYRVEFSPDGQTMAILSDGRVTLFYGQLLDAGDGSNEAR